MNLENCALLWKISSYAPVLLDMFFYSVEKYVTAENINKND